MQSWYTSQYLANKADSDLSLSKQQVWYTGIHFLFGDLITTVILNTGCYEMTTFDSLSDTFFGLWNSASQ